MGQETPLVPSTRKEGQPPLARLPQALHRSASVHLWVEPARILGRQYAKAHATPPTQIKELLFSSFRKSTNTVHVKAARNTFGTNRHGFVQSCFLSELFLVIPSLSQNHVFTQDALPLPTAPNKEHETIAAPKHIKPLQKMSFFHGVPWHLVLNELTL